MSGSPLERSPWVTFAAVLLGCYVFVLDAHIIGLALLSIAADLARPGGLDVDWAVTIYLLGTGTAVPVTGWAANRIGPRRLFVIATIGFALGAAIGAVAPRLELLLLGRFVQGAGGGMLIPLGTSTIYDLFPPHQRGRAMSMWAVSVVSGPAVAQPIAGWAIATLGWRWVPAVFGLAAAASAIMSWTFMTDPPRRNASVAFDGVGWGLISVGVLATVVGTRQSVSWGLGSGLTVSFLTVAMVSILWFAIRSWRHPHPLIEVRMFRSLVFTAAVVTTSAITVGQFARINLIPVELQVVRGFSAGSAGTTMLASAVGVVVATPISGWAVNRIGIRAPMLLGVSLMAGGLLIWATMDPGDPVVFLIFGLILNGFGTGLTVVPAMMAVMGAAPDHLTAQASSVNELNRQLSAAVGLAVLGAIVVNNLGGIAPVGVDPMYHKGPTTKPSPPRSCTG